jgi:putative ATP-dependent endonuclease of OLD family
LLGVAELAIQLGFHVKAVMDSDKPGSSDDLIDDLLAVCEQVVVLPTRTAVEAALIRGVPGDKLRKTVEALEAEGYGAIAW